MDISDQTVGLTTHRAPLVGIVGNGRTCALIDAHGGIGWMCLPPFAQFPVFAGLLDPVHGGSNSIQTEKADVSITQSDDRHGT